MRKLVNLLLFALVSVTAMAQFQNPVKFSVEQKKISDSEFELVFTGKIDAGWHVYSTDIAEGGPTAATVDFDVKKGAEPVGKLTPAGKVHAKFDEMFGMDVTYMEGTAVFVQKMKITAPEYEVKGYLTFGACNDQNCIPPTTVDFSYSGKGVAAKAEKKSEAVEKKNADKQDQQETIDAPAPEKDQVADQDTALAETAETAVSVSEQNQQSQVADYWKPVVQELSAFGTEGTTADKSFWAIFLLGFLGGLVALFTPCVWPIIPMTVSFFLKRSKDKSKGVRDAFTYGVSIVVIYVALGLIVTGIFGASALNALSTNAIFNIFFFLMLVVFAASFMGAFEITLPSSWSSAVDSKAESTTGLLSIFLMAFTLVLVSFSCTGPIIGLLFV